MEAKTIEERAYEFCNSKEMEMGYIKGATDERAIFDSLPKVKAWIAMDKDGDTMLHFEKPIKWSSIWMSRKAILIFKDQLPAGCNPKWDDEPIEIEITLSMKGEVI